MQFPRNHSPEAMEEFFQSRPDPFNYQTPDHTRRAETYVQLIQQHSGFVFVDRLLDVGCGEGHLTCVLSEAAHYTAGIDVSATAIERAKKKYGDVESVEFFKADFLKAKTRRKYNVVVATAVLPYFDERWDKFLAAADRLLRKGGLLITSFVSEGCVTDPWVHRIESVKFERVDTREFTCNQHAHRAHVFKKR